MPIQLGCNFSLPLLDLLGRSAVDVDWIKLSRPDTVDEDLRLARPLRPVLLHTLGKSGRRPAEWEEYPWTVLARQLAAAGSPHVALHQELRPEDWDEPVDLRQQGREQALAMLERLVAGVQAVRLHLSIPLLVENIPYHGCFGAVRLAAMPEAFWQVVEATGAGLLLDSSHLRCTAYNLGVRVRAYARALPLAHVREIHVSGPRLIDGILTDCHHALTAEDYELLEWLLGETRPEIVTLEYGGTGELFETPERNDPLDLEAQLSRLRAMIG